MPWRLLLLPLSRSKHRDALSNTLMVPTAYMVWILRMLAVGVILDLAVSSVLGYFIDRVDQNRSRVNAEIMVAHCWDEVLGDALNKTARPILLREANMCVAQQHKLNP